MAGVEWKLKFRLLVAVVLVISKLPATNSFSTEEPNVVTTAQAIRTTTNSPSLGESIDPKPFVTVKLKGAMSATNIISLTCARAFSTEFQNSFQDTIGRVGNLISNGLMCSSGTGGAAIRTAAGDAMSFFLDHTSEVVFTTHVGVTPMTWWTFNTVENCSWEVRNYLVNVNNWRQPIIPNIPGCPSINVNSNVFTWENSAWYALR